MNDTFLKKSLLNTPETTVKVSTELHQNIMRAVRLSEPAGRKSLFNRVLPASATAGIAAIAIAVFFYLPPTRSVAPSPILDPGQSEAQHLNVSLQTMGDSLLAFSKNAPLAEQELRKELERLKSDLERFDFRS